MKSATKLKDEARKHEQREEWERAIQLYLRVLGDDEEGTDTDLPLYNRVGDLYVRLGRPNDAVTYYEQAADRYAEAGLFNNAIALCNKALRYQPNRLVVFRKLGQFCAQQGFLTDARRWYLEYADRMFRQHELDEAFSALADFAEISEDPDVRVHLARKLHEHGREDEALREFHRAWRGLQDAGRGAAADALQDDVRQLLPDAPPLSELAVEGGRGDGHHGAAQDLPTYGDSPADETEPERGDTAATAEAASANTTAIEEEGSGTPDETPPVESEPPEHAPLEGLESTQLSDGDSLRGVRTGTLDGLDTGRDDTLERMRGEPETAESSPLPLLSDAPAEAEAPEEADAPEEAEGSADGAADGGALGLPLLGDEPLEAEPSAEEQAASPPGTLPTLDGAMPRAAAGAGDRRASPAGESGYVDLYALLAPDEDRVETTRFFVQETEPTGDEEHDFAELLNQFRAKLAEHVPEDDAGSHYDLGLAFKEMELYDDAISEFQIALRAGQDRLKVFEELGQCFIQKRQYNVAVKVLSRALQFEHRDEIELIGVYYFLGEAYERMGQAAQARDSYERVLGLDIRFRDVQQRVARL